MLARAHRGALVALALAFTLALPYSAAVEAAIVRVTITNDAPAGGTYLTPLWVGFHDGSFDAFSAGAAASAGIEAIAEDGNPGPLGAAFGGAGLSGVVGGAPLAPGASASGIFNLATDGSNGFLSFASMVLPSSDFFIGNDDPLAIALGGVLDGTFSSASFAVQAVYDAGTEVNDFATSAGNGLFGFPGGQGGPNQGANEGGVVALASSAAYGAYLNGAGLDFTPIDFDGYGSIATVTIESVPVPVPASLPLIGSALAGLTLVRRRAG